MLFLPVNLCISLPRLFSLLSGVKDVSMPNLIMVRCPLVISGLAVFCRFLVVTSSLGKMF